jgi:hypothetical protein
MRPAPEHPVPTFITSNPGHNLFQRVMRIRSEQAPIERIVLMDGPDLKLTLRDTGPDGTPVAAMDRDTALHILWALDDVSAMIHVAEREIRIAPGDTILLPAGTPWRASPRMILCEIAAHRNAGTGIIGPTHGDETFHGYNRRTTYPSPPGLEIERWKITQPLSLPDSPSPYVIVDLVDPLAFVWPGGTDLIGRGECRVIPPRTGAVTLIPDGLGYALIVRHIPPDWHTRRGD